MQAEREELARLKSEEHSLADAQRFPWRRFRRDMEAGHSRRPAPRLAQSFLEVAKEWEMSVSLRVVVCTREVSERREDCA